MSLIAGVDLGGTKIAAGLVAADGTIHQPRIVPTPTHDAASILAAIVDLVDDWVTDGRAAAVGVAAAGFLDTERTTVVRSPNLPWHGVPIVAPLRERWGCRVVLENDATAAAWGEVRYGAGRGVDDVVLVTVGTGIGGGIVSGGRLLRGGSSAAAEIGHLRFERDGRPCGCGQRGCWEQYASGTTLTAALRDAGLSHADLADHPVAQQILTQFAGALGEGAASLVTVLDPSLIVFGGGVIAAHPRIVGLAEASIAKFSPTADDGRPLRVVPAELGNDAGLVGAAELARHGPD